MFNVSVLLLDDALKPATPLTNDAINETLRQFAPLSDISQGSVATHLRCGVIFSEVLLQFFSWFWQWNNFENRLIFDEVKAYKILGPQFLGPPCILCRSKNGTDVAHYNFDAHQAILVILAEMLLRKDASKWWFLSHLS